jgi:hypothetical protein
VSVNSTTPFASDRFSAYAAGNYALNGYTTGTGTSLWADNSGAGYGGQMFSATGIGVVSNVYSAAAPAGSIAVQADMDGLGRAGQFISYNTANTNQTIFAANTTTGLAATNAAAVWGQSPAGGRGGVFLAGNNSSSTIALQGQFTGTGAVDAIGVFGVSTPQAGWGYGVVGQGSWYGVFSFGDQGATGFKFFTIDHPLDPENKILRHASIESNEVLNVYRGNVVLDASGSAEISLPDYFEAINTNYSYNLTPIGGAANVYVKTEIIGGSFVVAGGNPGMKVSWTVYAERNDKYAQMHPEKKEMEMEKKDYMKGKYFDPESYGQPKENGLAPSDDMKSVVIPTKVVSNEKK